MGVMLRSRLARPLIAVLAFALLLSGPVSAFALLESDAQCESSTNPGKGAGATWRYNWGNTWYPQVTVTSVPSDEAVGELSETLGFIYALHQVDLSGNGVTVPVFGVSLLSPNPQGSLLKTTFNLPRVIAAESWVSRAGASKTGEGVYGLTTLFYNQFRSEEASAMDVLLFGLDLTPPNPVEHLSTGAEFLPQANGWTEINWRNIAWTSKPYDALSGVGGFKVKVNGKETAFAQNTAPNPLYEPYAGLLGGTILGTLPQLSNVTIEELPAGENAVEVITVDRATNESKPVKFFANVDPDTPEVEITSVKANARVPASPTLSVATTDAAGIARVKYYVDNVFVGESTTKPFSLKASLTSFSNGSHVLKAVAYDQIATLPGAWVLPHTSSDTVTFTLDKTAPVISGLSGGPSPFFPLKRDGYKDNFVVGFTSSEAAAATLTIRDSKGGVVRTFTKRVSAGRRASMVWNGADRDNQVTDGTYTWRLTLSDATGNKSHSASRTVAIRSYEIVRVGRNSVRIVAR